MDRRHFLAGCSAACAAVGAAEIPSFVSGGAVAHAAALPTTFRDGFAQQVGGTFRVYRGARYADKVTLARVADGPAKDARLEQFTLHLDGTYSPDLEPGTYTLVGPDGASREVHLESADARQYRATFCLLRDVARA